jgi:hypothetical protein
MLSAAFDTGVNTVRHMPTRFRAFLPRSIQQHVRLRARREQVFDTTMPAENAHRDTSAAHLWAARLYINYWRILTTNKPRFNGRIMLLGTWPAGSVGMSDEGISKESEPARTPRRLGPMASEPEAAYPRRSSTGVAGSQWRRVKI